jgi:hypothetical protein
MVIFGFHVQKTIELQASFWLAHYLFQGHGINFNHQTNEVSCVINSHHIPSPHVVHYLLN